MPAGLLEAAVPPGHGDGRTRDAYATALGEVLGGTP